MQDYTKLEELIQDFDAHKNSLEKFFQSGDVFSVQSKKKILHIKEECFKALLFVFAFTKKDGIHSNIRVIHDELAHVFSLVGDSRELWWEDICLFSTVIQRMRTEMVSILNNTSRVDKPVSEFEQLTVKVRQSIGMDFEDCSPDSAKLFLRSVRYSNMKLEQLNTLVADINSLLWSSLLMNRENNFTYTSYSWFWVFLTQLRDIVVSIIKKKTVSRATKVKKTPVSVSTELQDEQVEAIEQSEDFVFWNGIFSLLGKDITPQQLLTLNEEVCYDLLDEVDWCAYDKDALEKVINDIQVVLDNDAWKYRFGKILLRITIKEIIEHIQDKEKEIIEKEKEAALLVKRKDFARAFLWLYGDMYQFVDWTLLSLQNVWYIQTCDSFVDLQDNEAYYNMFDALYISFFESYQSIFVSKVNDFLSSNEALDPSLSAQFKKQVWLLNHMYCPQKFTQEKFFLAIQRKYLLGDFYQFLLDIKKDNPEISYVRTPLKKHLDGYTKK